MLIEKFEKCVTEFENQIALKVETDELTYAQLNACANHVAEEISRLCSDTDKTHTGILVEHGAGMIVSLLGALKAGRVYVPMDVSYPEKRLLYMLENSEASLVITNDRNFPLAEKLVGTAREPIAILNIDAINRLGEDTRPNPQRKAEADSPAYILYTSGSTGLPKGVIQNHGNVWYYTRNWIRIFDITPGTRMTLLTAFSHDGAVQDVFSALLGGAVLYPYDIKNAVNRTPLPEYLKQEKINIWHSVPTLFRYFADNLTPDDKFPDLRYILLGGEPLRKRDLEILRIRFPHVIMANVYGQTESSVACIHRMTATDSFDKPILGQPLDKTELLLVDDEDEIVEEIGSGEIVVACDHIAPGYWKDEENTKTRFTHDPDLGRLYWTGDLGAITGSGQIEMMGRKDFQVKIRGFRVETGEIETALLRYPGVEEAVVMVKTKETGEPFLCAYTVAGDKNGNSDDIDVDAIRDFLMNEVPDYMVPSYFVPLQAMPLTPNGKIDRKSLPDPALHGMGTDYVAPRDTIEETLAAIWAEILDLDKDAIGIDADFFELGGHSLKAVTVSLKIHKKLDVKLQLPILFSHTTIRKLGEYIKSASDETFVAVELTEKAHFYPLSSAQKRMYILQQMVPGSTHYNLPVVVRLEGALDIERVKKAFREIVRRHESLRTSFRMKEGRPVQEIHETETVVFNIPYHEPTAQSAGIDTARIKAIVSRFVRPFNLSQPCQLRVELIREAQDRNLLLADMHHIISDGTSMSIMAREFMAFYSGETLPPLRIQYKDFSQWQRRDEQRKLLQEQKKYWLDVFSGEIPVLELPTDFPRPVVQSVSGNLWRLSLGVEDSQAVKALARRCGSTIYMVLLALYNIFLSRLSGQEDIVVGTPVAGRNHDDVQPIIGMFVNTLAMRSQPQGEKTVEDFIAETRLKTIEAFSNSDYPFEELVERIQPAKDMGRSPLFDTMFALRNYEAMGAEIPEVEIDGLRLIPYEYNNPVTRFDMTLYADDGGEKIYLTLEYCTDLFKEETIHRFGDYFKTMVASVIDNPLERLSRLDMLDENEKEQILIEFNQTTTDYPADKTLYQLFLEQVQRFPDHTAVIGPNSNHSNDANDTNDTIDTKDGESWTKSNWDSLTYRQLYKRSYGLGKKLVDKGVGPDVIVGLMVERSLEMMTGIFGILAAGGAYLPIEPGFPPARISYMLTDSAAPLLVTTRELKEKVSVDFSNEYLFLEDLLLGAPDDVINERAGQPVDCNPGIQLQSGVTSAHLAYIIYTSGTTGKPKGTLTTHANVSRVVKETRYISLDENDNVLQLSNYAFDGSVFDIFGALLNGARLVLVRKEDILTIERLIAIIEEKNITVFFVTTALFNALTDLNIDSLTRVRKILFGGERVSVTHARRASDVLGRGKIIHVYGPTETTVYATSYFVDVVEENLNTVSIGKPISNTTGYVLDRHLAPCPIGVAGELYIGGPGVARGYLNQPDLTAERFINNPFVNGDTLYKSGDLVRFLPNGNIEFIGRRDQQVKIRGFRIELGEIEKQLAGHDLVKEAVVIARETMPGSGDRNLCAYIVPVSPQGEAIAEDEHVPDTGRKIDFREYLSPRLPDYMIPSFFVTIDAIPLTSNGKVDIKSLPEPETGIGDEDYVAPTNAIEEKLLDIWAAILGIDPQRIGIYTDFFTIGGHSLKAVSLLNTVHKAFNVKLDLQAVFKAPTISGMADLILQADITPYMEIEPLPPQPYYQLSYTQQRIWVLHQLNPGSAVFNMSGLAPLGESADEALVRNVVVQLVRRHESFRTYFREEGDAVVQVVNPVPESDNDVLINLEVEDLTALDEEILDERLMQLIGAERSRPFQLNKAPLFRVKLLKTTHRDDIILVNMHHIISDGWSIDLLRKDFVSIYEAAKKGLDNPLPPLRIQYKDYAARHNSLLADGEGMERARAFWRKQLDDNLSVLNLPYDFSVSMATDKQTAGYRTVVPKDVLQKLRFVAVDNKASLFMVLLAGFNLLLSSLRGQKKIIIGMPGAARQHEDLKNIIGLFVNTLILVNHVDSEEIFTDFLKRVQADTLNVLEFQGYPMEMICDDLKVKYPKLNVFFNMVNIGAFGQEELSDLSSRHTETVQDTKFELTLYLTEHPNGIVIQCNYFTQLFKPETVAMIMDIYKLILKNIAANPNQAVGQYHKSKKKRKMMRRKK